MGVDPAVVVAVPKGEYPGWLLGVGSPVDGVENVNPLPSEAAGSVEAVLVEAEDCWYLPPPMWT